MIYGFKSGIGCQDLGPTPWPGLVFPIPFGSWRGRIYRGLFFGAHGAQGSPIWSGLRRAPDGFWYVDHNARRLSATEADLRDFLSAPGKVLRPRAEDVFTEWLYKCIAKGDVGVDGIPLELHAIVDPNARQSAMKAYKSASE